jgi:hypothetical protein
MTEFHEGQRVIAPDPIDPRICQKFEGTIVQIGASTDPDSYDPPEFPFECYVQLDGHRPHEGAFQYSLAELEPAPTAHDFRILKDGPQS